MNFLVTLALPLVGKVLSTIFTEENIHTYGDRLFDLIEDVVTDSATPIDDRLVLPVVSTLRRALGIEDRDGRDA